jgi:hypothetical protein
MIHPSARFGEARRHLGHEGRRPQEPDQLLLRAGIGQSRKVCHHRLLGRSIDALRQAASDCPRHEWLYAFDRLPAPLQTLDGRGEIGKPALKSFKAVPVEPG